MDDRIHSAFGGAYFRLNQQADSGKTQMQDRVKEGFLFLLKDLIGNSGKKDIDQFDQALHFALFQCSFNVDQQRQAICFGCFPKGRQ